MGVIQTKSQKRMKGDIDVLGEALEETLMEGVYLIKPNVREFRESVGKDIKEESQIKAEAPKMVKSGRCEVLVISLKKIKLIGILVLVCALGAGIMP